MTSLNTQHQHRNLLFARTSAILNVVEIFHTRKSAILCHFVLSKRVNTVNLVLFLSN